MGPGLARTVVLGVATSAALIAALAAPGAVAAAVTDPVETWVPDGEVKAATVSGSTLYIGGNFSRIAPYTGSSALFNAASGELEKPWPEVNGVVNDVVSDGSGGWYLAGDFKSVGGAPRTDLAHVLADGTLDPNFAPSTNGEVRALAVDGTTAVYAGGEFSQANGTARGNLAGFSATTGALNAFDGSVSFVTPPNTFDPLGVYALLLKDSKLYVGGEFSRASGQVRLHGAAFSVPSGAVDMSWNPSTNRVINGLALDSDGADIFIGGRFSRVNALPPPPDNNPFLTGVGRNGVAKVDEATGTANPSWVAPVQGGTDLATLIVSGSWVYIAGTVNVGPGDQRRVAAYNVANNNAGINNNWHPVPVGGVQSLAAAGSTVYIGSGAFTDNVPQPAIIGVDATNFASTATPSFAPVLGRGRQALPSGQGAGVRAIGANGSDVVAGGTFTTVGGVDRRNLGAIDLNTGQATAFNPPMKGMFSALVSVNAVAVTDDGVVWAGGQFITEGPSPRTHLAAFDRASGALTSFHRDPNGTEGVNALVASGTTVYVGGNFTTIGTSARRFVAAVRHVPGEAGTVLPFDVHADGSVRALALAGSTLYIGGQFSTVNGGLASLTRERRNLVAVDATTGLATDWDPDADAAVLALAVGGDTVYAGGDFTTVNKTLPRSRIAAFDRQNGAARDWAPGADGTVRALAVHGPTVFAGGEFGNAGGVPRTGIADFDAQTGTPDTFSPSLDTEERSGPAFPPVARVGALFASPEAGLVIGGTHVRNSPAPRTANLSVFGLAPLPAPPGGGPDGGGGGVPPGAGGGTGTVPLGDGTDPTLGLAASRKRFRVARGATSADGTATAAGRTRRRRTPAGTTLTLSMTEPARVKFEVLVKGKGRRSGRKCVKQTRRNRKRKRCTLLTLKKPVFTRSAPAGRSRVTWSGRLGRKALKRGAYVLRATPTDAAGNTGNARQISITIVR
jgi:hypothetical protein